LFRETLAKERQKGLTGSTTHAEQVSEQFLVLTSRMRRAVETVACFSRNEYNVQCIRALNELCAGSMEGLIYDEIKHRFPSEWQARRDNKLRYRYPGSGGESYADVIERLQPIIVELERTHDSTLVVAHKVVLRTILAYIHDLPAQVMIKLDVPLHTLYCIEPMPYGYELKRWRYVEEKDMFEELS